MDLGDPPRLRPAVAAVGLPGGGDAIQHHHMPVPASQGEGFGSPVYATNSQFLYGNGDLMGLPSSQFPSADLFASPELNWQQQEQRPSNFEQFNHTSTSEPFNPQYNSNVWPSTLGAVGGYVHQQAGTVTPTHISNVSANSHPHALRSSSGSLGGPNDAQDIQQPISTGQHPTAVGTPVAGIAAQVTFVNGAPHVSLHYGNEYPEFVGQIRTRGYLGPTSSGTSKRPRTSAASSVPSPPVVASPPDTVKVGSKLQAASSKGSSGRMDDPLYTFKAELQQVLDDEDEEDIRVVGQKVWEIVSNVNTDKPDFMSAAVETLLRFGDDEVIRYMGQQVPFTVRLRKWVVGEHNKDKKSPLVPKMLKVSSQTKGY